MEININNKFKMQDNTNTIPFISSLILASLPVFSPYRFLGPIPLNIILIIFGCSILAISNASIKYNVSKSIILLWFIHLFLSTIASFSTELNVSLLNSLIVGSLTVIGIGYLWSNSELESYFRSANIIGIVACLFLFYQAFSLATNRTPPSGRIIGLKLLEYSTFVKTTWGFRLNSFFQEPSYFAIYTLPLFSYNIQKEKWFTSLFYLVALILSTSSLGILGSFIIILYFFFKRKANFKYIIIVPLIIICIHYLLLNISGFYAMSIMRSFDKLNNLLETSAIRLSGQSFLFKYLPPINQFIGVGINQMQNYFLKHSLSVDNYSNSIIITLINTGIVGLVVYIIFILSVVSKSIKNNRLIFSIIFIAVALTDYLIYNSFFYYLLGFVFIENIKSKRSL